MVGSEVSQHGVRELAIHFHSPLPREGEALTRGGGASVAENAIEDVGEIVGEKLGLGQLFRPGRPQQARPLPQDVPRLLGLRLQGQRRRPGARISARKRGLRSTGMGDRESTVSDGSLWCPQASVPPCVLAFGDQQHPECRGHHGRSFRGPLALPRQRSSDIACPSAGW